MTLHVIPPTRPLEPPADRGRLLSAQQVAFEIFEATRSPAWVRRHVPGKIVLGHSTVRWFEYDVRAWLEAKRPCASGAAVVP